MEKTTKSFEEWSEEELYKETKAIKTTDYKGIDYGLGRSNISNEGIRYGVISQNVVGTAWYEDSVPWYGTDSEAWTEEEWDFAEPISFFFEDEEYYAECGEDGDIFVMKSPYFTYAQFCSPCAPGAVHLENPLSEPDPNNKGFCLGHKWFEEEVAPYPVYSVKTGELVQPKRR